MLFLGKIIFGDEVFVTQNVYKLPLNVKRQASTSLSVSLRETGPHLLVCVKEPRRLLATALACPDVKATVQKCEPQKSVVSTTVVKSRLLKPYSSELYT